MSTSPTGPYNLQADFNSAMRYNDAAQARAALDMADLTPLLDSDLQAIAALSTTSFGRGLLAMANAAAAKVAIVDGQAIAPASVASVGAISGTTITGTTLTGTSVVSSGAISGTTVTGTTLTGTSVVSSGAISGTALTATGLLTIGAGTVATRQAVSGNGAVDAVNLTTTVTTIENTGTADTTTTLAAGDSGQYKEIAFILDGGFDAVITVTNPAWGGVGTITMADVGDSIALRYLGSLWVVVSNNGSVLA